MLTNENLFFIFANFNWFHVIFRFRVHLRLKMAEENIENEEYNEVPQLKASTF